MLKFFRKYNKWLLAVGGTLLMVAFLIGPALDIFKPQMGGEEIGQIKGAEVTLGERLAAAHELELLESLPIPSGVPLLRLMLPLNDRGDAPLAYMLMQREAADMGLTASDAEVGEVLMALRMDTRQMAVALQRLRITEDAIHQTLRRWIVVQNYIPLVTGRTHVPVPTRVSLMMQRIHFAQANPFESWLYGQLAQGTMRVSEPLLAHFLSTQQATISGEAALLGHEPYLDRVGEPTDEQLTELFVRFRDQPLGGGQPYGFGYRSHAQVKIEWLRVPGDVAAGKVFVDEAEALEHYEQNRDRFALPGGGVASYASVRERVVEDLRALRADELAMQTARAAQSALQEDPAVRRLSREGGYAQVGAEFAPMSLEDAARRAEQRRGITPTVERREGWVLLSQVSALPGIGEAGLVGRGVGFPEYLASAREFKPAADNPLVPLRLQRGLPSELLRAADGSYYIFRILDATPARTPETLDEVRTMVTDDWRKLRAYELLKEDRDAVVAAVRERGLRSVAGARGGDVLSYGPVARREASFLGMGFETPLIPGIGQSDALLDAMFEVAEAVTAGDDAPIGSLAALDEASRVGAAGVDSALALAVFRVDSYQPITRELYERNAPQPLFTGALDHVLLRDLEPQDPFSLRAIARRVGYTGEGVEDRAHTSP